MVKRLERPKDSKIKLKHQKLIKPKNYENPYQLEFNKLPNLENLKNNISDKKLKSTKLSKKIPK